MTDLERIAHRKDWEALRENIAEHLLAEDVPEQKRKALEAVLAEAEQAVEAEGPVTRADKDRLATARKVAGVRGKAHRQAQNKENLSIRFHSTRLIELLIELQTEFWRDTKEGLSYFSVRVEDVLEHYRLSPPKLEAVLKRLNKKHLYKTHKWVDVQTVKNVLAWAEAECMDGPRHPVYVRYGMHAGCLYIDYGDDTWEACKVGPDGWEDTVNHPVRFVRGPIIQPMVYRPARGGSFRNILQVMNFKERDLPGLSAWLLSAMWPDEEEYCALIVNGPYQSGKSFATTRIRDLIDPSKLKEGSIPSERTLAILARQQRVLLFGDLQDKEDNRTKDAYAQVTRLLTEGGFITRTLYADEEATVMSSSNPFILSGVSNTFNRNDQLSRSIIIETEVLDATRGKRKQQSKFEDIAPKFFGAVLDGIAHCLKIEPEKADSDIPFRMEAAVLRAEACEQLFGLPAGSTKEFFVNQRANSSTETIEESDWVDALEEGAKRWKADHGEWFVGPMKQFYEYVLPIAKRMNCEDTFPSTITELGREMNRLAPDLKQDRGIVRKPVTSRNYKILILDEAQPATSVERTGPAVPIEPEPEPKLPDAILAARKELALRNKQKSVARLRHAPKPTHQSAKADGKEEWSISKESNPYEDGSLGGAK